MSNDDALLVPKAADAYSSAAITAIISDIIVADRHTPPHNGKEVIEKLEHALNGLALYDFTAKEFCQPSSTQDTSRIAKLRVKQALQAANEAAAAKAAQDHIKSELDNDDANNTEEQKTVRAELARTLHLDSVTSEILASMKARAPKAPVAAYAPRDLSSTTNSLDNYTSVSTVLYMDPLTDAQEVQSLASQRSIAMRLLEKVFLTNHAHVIVSCKYGDIAAIWSLARALCIGDAENLRLDTITSMVQMVRSPPSTWPELSHLVTQIQLRLTRDVPVRKSFEVGDGLLPAFTMRALQSSNFEHLRVDITLLHKVAGDITVSRILTDMNAAHSLSLTRPNGRALLGNAQTPNPPASVPPPRRTTSSATGLQMCFNFRDKGTCRFGDKCRYDHGGGAGRTKDSPQLDGVCASCSSRSHGLSQCPTHKQRLRKAGTAKAELAKANLAKLTSEVATLKAFMASIPAAPTAPAPVDPQVEIQRLQAQLAASYAANPWVAYGPAAAALPP